MRYFNVGGVCDPEVHYMVPAAARVAEVIPLVEKRAWFVVHAPRQSGKTTSLRAIARELTAEGRYAALHFSCEAGQAMGDDYGAVEAAVWAAIRGAASEDLPAPLRPPDTWPPDAPAGMRINVALRAWSRACPLPLVLVFDEIDALWGRGLESVLRQLRAGHPDRPGAFPSSVVLCGMRDVRDYKKASGGDPTRLGSASPFNILVDSLRIGNFDKDQVRDLYAQYTAETGQVFVADAIDRAMELTGGQPWLVNALAREVVEKIRHPLSEPITVEILDKAKERLILARATHLDSLVARLMEDRVRRVLEPMLAGALPAADPYDDDYAYVTDLGLLSPGMPVRIANPIYREVIVRVLGQVAERAMTVEPRSFVLPDGTLDLRRVLSEFTSFWMENSEILTGRMPYHEVACQLILMAWLQRIANGGGFIDREYGIGRGRIDLLLRWPWRDGEGRRRWQREALEMKVWAPGRPDPFAKGLVQLDGYLAQTGLDAGVLVLFDRRPDAPPVEERTRFEEAVTASGRKVTVLRG